MNQPSVTGPGARNEPKETAYFREEIRRMTDGIQDGKTVKRIYDLAEYLYVHRSEENEGNGKDR